MFDIPVTFFQDGSLAASRVDRIGQTFACIRHGLSARSATPGMVFATFGQSGAPLRQTGERRV